jgi:RNA polymerase sigma-70 factor, ECF subfamily
VSPSAKRSPEGRPTLQLVRSDGPDDAELLAGVRQAEPSFADAFCRRVWPIVAQVARRLLGAADSEWEDVAQVAVMEVLGSVGRYSGQGTLDGWVRTVAAHTVYKHLRRRGLERRLFSGLELAEPQASERPGPRLAAQTRQAVSRVLEHVGRLDEDKAVAWALHDVHGYDLKEVAAITQVSEAAAQTRLSRGRRELHERLQKDAALVELLSHAEGEAS